MSPRDSHLLINANFSPARSVRRLSRLTRIFGSILVVFIVGALVLYGITVHFDFKINELSKEAIALSEQNKELQVQLNRIKSFKNVEATAARVPHLSIPEQVIDITAIDTDPLPSLPARSKAQPRIYGY